MKLIDILVWALFILSLAVSAWFIFGNSPTFEQAILVLVVTFLFTLHAKIISQGAQFHMFLGKFKRLEESFIKLADDFRGLKGKKL